MARSRFPGSDSDLRVTDSDFPLIEFQHWLIRDRKVSIRTSATYISCLRSFFCDRETAERWISDSRELLWQARDFDSTLSPGTRSPFRCALRAFLSYTQLRLGTHLGITFSDGRRKKWEAVTAERQRVLAPLGPLLRELERRRFPLARIPFLRWRDVRGGVEGSNGAVEDKLEGRVYAAPLDTIRAIGMWAGGGEKPDPKQPFVPAEPKSLTPMRKKRLLMVARGE